jgi:hypothetical protein
MADFNFDRDRIMNEREINKLKKTNTKYIMVYIYEVKIQWVHEESD